MSSGHGSNRLSVTTVVLAWAFFSSLALAVERSVAGNGVRDEILSFWKGLPPQQVSFEIVYGRCEVGPDWTLMRAVDEKDPVRRRGILRWEKQLYLLVRESVYPGAERAGNRMCRWYDGAKTCRFGWRGDAGVVAAGMDGNELPDSRILQGYVFDGISIPMVIASGGYKRRAGAHEFSYEHHDGVKVECSFPAAPTGYPQRVLLHLPGGVERTIEYAALTGAEIPTEVVVTSTLNVESDGATEAFRYRVLLQATPEEPDGPFAPWYPPGVTFNDEDTAEVFLADHDPQLLLDGQVQAFLRLRAGVDARFVTLREAFEGVVSAGAQSPHWGVDISRSEEIAGQVEARATDRWKCGATVSYAALCLLGLDPGKAAAKSLVPLGSAPVRLDELERSMEVASSKSLAWVDRTSEELATMEGDCIVLLDSASSDPTALSHVILATLDKDRVKVFDFPKAPFATSKSSFFPSGRSFTILELEPSRAGGGGGLPLGLGAALLLLGGLFGYAWIRDRKRSLHSAGSMAVILLLVSLGCAPQAETRAAESERSAGESAYDTRSWIVEMEPVTEPLKLGGMYPFQFTVRNGSDEMKGIQVLSKTCGCMQLELATGSAGASGATASVEPGGAVSGTVLLRPADIGPSTESFVVGSDVEDATRVEVSFVAYAPVHVRPKTVVLRDVEGELVGSFDVLVTPPGAREETDVVIRCPDSLTVALEKERITAGSWETTQVKTYGVRRLGPASAGPFSIVIEDHAAVCAEEASIEIRVLDDEAW